MDSDSWEMVAASLVHDNHVLYEVDSACGRGCVEVMPPLEGELIKDFTRRVEAFRPLNLLLLFLCREAGDADSEKEYAGFLTAALQDLIAVLRASVLHLAAVKAGSQEPWLRASARLIHANYSDYPNGRCESIHDVVKIMSQDESGDTLLWFICDAAAVVPGVIEYVFRLTEATCSVAAVLRSVLSRV